MIRISGEWHIDCLDLRGRRGEVIQGDGHSSVIVHKGCGPAVDMTGASHCTIRDVRIKSMSGSCGILLARNQAGDSAGCHSFERITVEGFYAVASVINVASEVNSWRDCFLANTGGGVYCGADEPTVYVAGAPLAVTSPLGPVGGNKNNCMCNTFDGCVLALYGLGIAGRSIVTLGTGNQHVSLRDCCMSAKECRPHSVVRCYRTADRSDGNVVANLAIEGCRFETAAARHLLCAEDECGSIAISDARIVNNFVEVSREMVYTDSLTDSLLIDGNRIICRSPEPWSSPSGKRSVVVVGGGRNCRIRWRSNFNGLYLGGEPAGAYYANNVFESTRPGVDANNEVTE